MLLGSHTTVVYPLIVYVQQSFLHSSNNISNKTNSKGTEKIA